MRTTGIILLINLFSLCSIFKCSEADHTSNVESDVVSETANEEDGMATHQPDTILIEFDGGINILWDNVNDTIIKDENYYSLSQEPININIVNAISDTSIVSNHVCSKHSFVQGMREFDKNYGTHHSDDWYNAMAWWGSLSRASLAWWDLDVNTRNA